MSIKRKKENKVLRIKQHVLQQSRSSRDVVHEGGEWLDCLVADVLELHNQVSTQLLINDSHRNGVRLIGQEVPIVGSLELNFEICKEWT